MVSHKLRKTYKEDLICEKCGCVEVYVNYKPSEQLYMCGSVKEIEPEKLEITCQSCGYTWAVEPLDALDRC